MSSSDILTYGWGTANEPTEKLWLRFSRCSREPQSWAEELTRAATEIARRAKKPLWICASGGTDSETVCEVFHSLNIPFSVLTVEFMHGENAHDTIHAKEWCAKRGVTQKIFKLDIQDFVAHQIPVYMQEGYIGSAISRYVQLKLLSIVNDMDGFLVSGWGELVFQVDRSKALLRPEDVYLHMDVGYAAPFEWCKRNKAEHEPYFYYATPELMLAWLREPMIDAALRNPEYFRHTANTHALKNAVMRSHFPEQRWRVKYTGYEKIDAFRLQTHKHLISLLGPKIQYVDLPVQELIRQLSPQ